mgnify:CR=1 FL=1
MTTARNIDYWGIVTRSARVAWDHKFLWFFGFFAAGGGGGGGGGGWVATSVGAGEYCQVAEDLTGQTMPVTLTGTFAGLTPVAEIDRKPMPAVDGPVTQRLRDLYEDLVERTCT